MKPQSSPAVDPGAAEAAPAVADLAPEEIGTPLSDPTDPVVAGGRMADLLLGLGGVDELVEEMMAGGPDLPSGPWAAAPEPGGMLPEIVPDDMPWAAPEDETPSPGFLSQVFNFF